MKRAETARALTRPPRLSAPGSDEHSRQRIHAAALALFARYGYDGVSLQQIADEVGLHKSSLFHHYANKSALLVEVFAQVIAGVLEHLTPLRSADPPALSTFLAVFDALTDHFCDQPDAARLLLAAMTSPADSVLRQSDANDFEIYRTVASFLERARRAGAIGRVHIRQAIPNLIGLVLMYPAVARDLPDLTGKEPFSPRARAVRKEELSRMVRTLLACE